MISRRDAARRVSRRVQGDGASPVSTAVFSSMRSLRRKLPIPRFARDDKVKLLAPSIHSLIRQPIGSLVVFA